MKKLLLIFATALTLVFAGCESFGGDDVVGGSYNINGSIQKGPFIQGSSITIQPLNNKLNPTGQMFTTQTTNDAGLFSMEGISSKYAEIIATGYYFNEIAGSVSTGTLTLRSIADLEDGGQANVNLLTTIIFQRVHNLVKNENISIPEATAKAERELFLTLNIPEDKIPDIRCERMNISEDGEHNGLLLAISVVLQQYRSIGDLSELIAKMGSDLANDGQLDASIMSKLTISAYTDDLVEQVSNNLLNRYNDLGVKGVIPPFAEYLKFFQDFDGDGIIDPSPYAVLEFDDMRVDAAATAFYLPFLYIDMEACEISVSDNTPEAKEWVTITIDGDKCFVAVAANTTESERYCEIIIKERKGKRFVTFTIVQNPSYKIEYTYNPATSTGELWLNCDSGIINTTYNNGEGVLYYYSPICYINGVHGDITSITLPSSVERIAIGAFSNCPNLVEFRGPLASEDGMLLISNGVILAVIASVTECTIPDSVTEIGVGAFYGCYSLTSITIPYSVTEIGGYAFQACTSLTSITIPDSVASIGEGAFKACYSLTSITIPDSVTEIGGHAFQACSSLTSITIPDSVTSIGEGAFKGCSSLTSITIPNSVTSIGMWAFSGCSNLTSITFEQTTPPVLGNDAFNGVENLVINIPEEAIMAYLNCNWPEEYKQKIVQLQNLSPDNFDPGYIITYATSDGQKLTTVHNKSNVIFHSYSDGVGLIVYSSPVTSIGGSAFKGCTSLTSITIPDSVASIGEGAFKGCSSLTSITIPNSVTSIGMWAFTNCTSLTSITIPDSVTEIGEGALSGCSSLASVTIPDSVTEIGSGTFTYCTSLESITIPDSVTSIGEEAFVHCTSLESITIPNSVTSIGRLAFYGWGMRLTSVHITDIAAWCGITFGDNDANPLHYAHNLYLNGKLVTDLVIPDGVTSIGDYAFEGCKSLTSVTIPDSVTSIGYHTFSDCTSLTSVTIGNSVTSIGERAFLGCTSLTSVTIGNSVTSIGDYSFFQCSTLTSITIPDSVTEIGGGAFRACYSLTSVTIGNSVTSIGDDAFRDCYSLTEAYCRPTTPPKGGFDMFAGTNSELTIYVPSESVETYKTTRRWSNYADHIVGYDFNE